MKRNAPALPRRRARGMTLIEVLVAMMIMTVGILGLLTMMAKASQTSMTSDDTQRASTLLNDAANQMLMVNNVSLPAASLAAWKARVAGTQQGLPSGVGTVTATSATSARILIKWTPPNGTERQAFTDVQLN